MVKLKEVKKLILDISFKKHIGHIGSCLGVANILSTIYNIKNPDDIVILSNGHAGLSLYCVLKLHKFNINPESKGTHPDINKEEGIMASTGSLGHGIGIAVGYALDRTKQVYCVTSDGETAEGSWWESLDIAVKQKLSNFKVVINCNGYSAYRESDINELMAKVMGFGAGAIMIDDDEKQLTESLQTILPDIPMVVLVRTNSNFGSVKGLDAHYKPLEKRI
jgi:transketolase